MKKNIKTEVRVIESRVVSAETIQRLMLSVQFDSLAKAERLRQVGLAFQRAFATQAEGRKRVA